MWTFVGQKAHKVWLWLAVERATRRIVAWTLGGRGEKTCSKLWEALPASFRENTWYFTDEWAAYAKVLPAGRYYPSLKGSDETSIVEAIHCALRQRCGVLVRKTCSFSKCLKMHWRRIQLVIDEFNNQSTPI
jgi:insertion element IS1 protein InsB